MEKAKWDPKTLQPFDRVLVRDNKEDEGYMDVWKNDIFFMLDDKKLTDFPFKTISDMYAYCVPYNEETKHLLGTNQEAPEYYRV